MLEMKGTTIRRLRMNCFFEGSIRRMNQSVYKVHQKNFAYVRTNNCSSEVAVKSSNVKIAKVFFIGYKW